MLATRQPHPLLLPPGAEPGFTPAVAPPAPALPGSFFASSGQVLDVSVPDSPIRSGAFAYEGNLVPHTRQQKIVMLSYSPPADVRSTNAGKNTLALRTLDPAAYRELFETPLGGQYTIVHDFVEVKPGLFAFIDGDDPHSLSSGKPKASLYSFRAPDFAE